jgi:Lrp/AsnC family leucine-responsive transcriptional regulator
MYDYRSNMPTVLDDIDKRILRVLQRDGRIANVDLADAVGLSPSPCLRRVKLLEEAGVIERYVAVLSAPKVGLGLTMFARVWLTAQDAETIDRFIAAMRKLEEVVECYIMLGESDALLRVVVADLGDYRRFQAAHLTRINGIQNVKTDVPSETIKQSYALPLR